MQRKARNNTDPDVQNASITLPENANPAIRKNTTLDGAVDAFLGRETIGIAFL
jgi:hypothetical protein